MELDLKKLENVKTKADGKVTARCPACAVDGGDRKGEHLVIFPDGKYGCAVFVGDKDHNRQIFRLTGQGESRLMPIIEIRKLEIPDSKVIRVLGQSGQKNKSLNELADTPVQPPDSVSAVSVAESSG